MKRWIAWFEIVLIFLLMLCTSVTYAEEKHILNIQVVNTGGGMIDLKGCSYRIGSGDVSLNQIQGTPTMMYGDSSLMNINITSDTFQIITYQKKDIDLLIYIDMGEYVIFISDVIKADYYMDDDSYDKKYYMNKMDEVQLSASVEGLSDCQTECFLYKGVYNHVNGDEIMGAGFTLEGSKHKKVFLLRGMYHATYICTKGSQVYLYEDDEFTSNINMIQTNVIPKEDLETLKCTIPNNYDAYPYYLLSISLNSGEILPYWGARDTDSAVEIIYPKDRKPVTIRMYISDTFRDMYSKSIGYGLSHDVVLSEQYKVDEIESYTAMNGVQQIVPLFVDYNGNELRFIDISRPEDFYLEVTNSDGEMAHEQSLNKYWSEFSGDLSAGTYKAKIFSLYDTNCIETTVFKLIVGQDGKLSFIEESEDDIFTNQEIQFDNTTNNIETSNIDSNVETTEYMTAQEEAIQLDANEKSDENNAFSQYIKIIISVAIGLFLGSTLFLLLSYINKKKNT